MNNPTKGVKGQTLWFNSNNIFNWLDGKINIISPCLCENVFFVLFFAENFFFLHFDQFTLTSRLHVSQLAVHLQGSSHAVHYLLCY
jgi:hypothetical protein